MKKKYKNSYIMRMHIESEFAREILGVRNPKAFGEPIVVTQVESIGEKYIICEITSKEEYQQIVEVPTEE